jgi:pimeloyl-ACP methyl ester carboxylesterase
VRAGPLGRLALLALSLAVLVGSVGCGTSENSGRFSDRTPVADEYAECTPQRTPRVDWREPPGHDPAGVILLIHGGGWRPNHTAYSQQRAYAAGLRAGGFATVVIGYGEGAEGFCEIQRTYAEIRRRYRDLPVCAYGTSAGGHLALMLATREADLDCVVDLVGPTDLRSLDDQGGGYAHRLAVKAFGEDHLGKYSPVRYARSIEAKVLMIFAENDPVTPVEQGKELARALPSAELFVLPPGPVPWLHFSSVTQESLDTANELAPRFIEEATLGS